MNLVKVHKIKMSSEGWTEFRRLFWWTSRTKPRNSWTKWRTYKVHM